MLYNYKFVSTEHFELSTNSLDDVYALIQYKWGVQKFQVSFAEIETNEPNSISSYYVKLTNKLGEYFACIGTLEDYQNTLNN